MTKQRNGTQLNCFSPPVMVATLIIELCLAGYTIWRYRLNTLGRLVLLALLSLAAFQLCEFHVCTGYGPHAVRWSRAGFVAITLLPPLGLHILHVLAGKKRRRLVRCAYATMVVFVGYFLTYHAAFIGYECTGNYVIFQIGTRLSMLYAAYYYGWLIAAIGLAIRWTGQSQAGVPAIKGLVVGYFVFLLPVAAVNFVDPASRRGIPSIMCGFAVLFALILTLYVLPHAGARRAKTIHKAD